MVAMKVDLLIPWMKLKCVPAKLPFNLFSPISAMLYATKKIYKFFATIQSTDCK